MTFSPRDYAHLDHGYAATVRKAQGVTVDRAHVLATPQMDGHPAYVGLTRHREGVSLHYAREDFVDPRRLARVLSRERAKDTTLDYSTGGYGREDDLVQRYAERRGVAPISGHAAAHVPAAEVAPPAPRRSMFAGPKLGAGWGTSPDLVAGAPEPVRPGADRLVNRTEMPRGPIDPQAAQGLAPDVGMRQGLAAYATEWADAERITRAGLPVLPHQQNALARSGEALDAMTSHPARDTRSALERNPGLARAAGTAKGAQALEAGIGVERSARLVSTPVENSSKVPE